VGKKAAEQLVQLGVTPAAAIRHPANGGARAFAQGLEALREDAAEEDERARRSTAAGRGHPASGCSMNLPIGHPLRRQPLGPMAAQCRNLHSKEWRDLARWHIATLRVR
jgi:hypothetical protein